jgi:hypothetical protein
MFHRLSCALLGLFAILPATFFRLSAAEKTAKDNQATAEARQQVAAALRAEIAGKNDQRAELLASAARAAPDLPEANWNLARVHVSGKWLTLDDAQQQAAGDPQLAEYRQLRDQAGDNPKLIRGLARWCVKVGRDDAARLHYAQLLVARGTDVEMKLEAIKRLNLINVDGTWMTGDELAAQRQKTKAIEDALIKWRPRLKRLQVSIDSGDFARRDHALKELEELDDPQIIPVLESFLLDGEDRFQEEQSNASQDSLTATQPKLWRTLPCCRLFSPPATRRPPRSDSGLFLSTPRYCWAD